MSLPLYLLDTDVSVNDGLVLVTSNTKHFERMQHLSMENWMT